MALNSSVQVLTAPGGTGQQTYSLAGGFSPKAIILWATPQTADGSAASWALGVGFATRHGGVVQQRFTCMRGLDAAGSADNARGSGTDRCLVLQTQSAGASSRDLEISFVSWGTGDQVILDWTNLHTTASVRVFMMVLGGDDITDALADHWVADTTTTTQDMILGTSSISFLAAGTTGVAISGNPTAPGIPAGCTNNQTLMICKIESCDNVASTMPGGWNLQNQQNQGSLLRQTIFTRVFQTGDTAPTITHTAGGAIQARIFAFNGVDTTTNDGVDQIAATGTTAAGTPTTVPAPTVTPSVQGCALIYAASGAQTGTSTNVAYGTYSGTDPIPAEAVADYRYNSGTNQPSACFAWGIRKNAAATGTRSSSASAITTPAEFIGTHIVLKPDSFDAIGQPDLVFTMCNGAIDVAANNPKQGFGFGKKGEAGRSVSFGQVDGNTASLTAMRQRSDRVVCEVNATGASAGTDVMLGQLDTTTANWPANGVRIIFDGNPAANDVIHFLALTGALQATTGANTAPTAGGLPVTQDNDAGFTPKLGVLFGWNLAASSAMQTSAADQAAFGIGAYDGTQEAWAGITEDDAALTMDSNNQQSTAKVIRNYSPAAALQSEADGVFSGNNFRLSWNDIDSVAREYQWLVLGDAAASGTQYDETGTASSSLDASGVKVKTKPRTGTASSSLGASAAEDATYTETGTARSALGAAGLVGRKGTARSVLAASGNANTTYAETGTATSPARASGVKTVTHIYTETGAARSILAASAAENAAYTETGTARSMLGASAGENVTYPKTGSAYSQLRASGDTATTHPETGTARSVLAATGVDNAAYREMGVARIGSGGNLVEWVGDMEPTVLPWYVTGTSVQSMSVTRSTDQAHSPTHAAHFDGHTNQASGYIAVRTPIAPAALQPNTDYALNVWVKIQSQSNVSGVVLRWTIGASTGTVAVPTGTSAWQLATIAFTSPGSISTPCHVGVEVSNTPGQEADWEIFVDDASLTIATWTGLGASGDANTTYNETGVAYSPLGASGVKGVSHSGAYNKTGTAYSQLRASAPEDVGYTRAATASSSLRAGGDANTTYNETGSVGGEPRPVDPAEPGDPEVPDRGLGASGVESRLVAKTGAAYSQLRASATRATTSNRTGTARSELRATGDEARTIPRTGTAYAQLRASALQDTTFPGRGVARSELRATGQANTTYNRTGTARSSLRASATRSVAWTRTGAAYSQLRAFGSKTVPAPPSGGYIGGGPSTTTFPGGPRFRYELFGAARIECRAGGASTIDRTLTFEYEDEEALILLGMLGGPE